MNIYVLNESLERIAIIDNYTSIIWTNRYYEAGDFELYLQATSDLIAVLQEDYYLIREGHEDNAMIIESIEISTDIELGNFLTIRGRCLKSIVYRRIIWQQTSMTGLLETCLTRLLNENIIAPSNPKRKIANFSIDNLVATGLTISAQYTGDNLGESIAALCTSYGFGWDVKLDLEQKKFLFILYAGTDRSYRQNVVPWVVFSNAYENILTTDYTFDKSEYANVVKVAGEGEGIARKYASVGDASGLARREIYADARDLSTNEGEITSAEYNEQLKERGLEALAERVDHQDFEGEVVDYTYKYGEDYFLGDIVEVVNEYGMEAVTRVIEVISSEDESGIYTIPTFSSYI